MGSTYTRQSSAGIVDGGVIEASDLNNEFDQLLAAFAVTTGHSHDGTAAEGGPVTKLLGTSLTIGDGTAGTDITLTFDGEDNDGVITWMEDEDLFKFTDVINVGVDDAGHDVKFFGAASGSYLLWDESADSLLLTDDTPLKIGDSQDLTLYHDGSNSYITNAVGALKVATETSGIAVTIGHTTSETTVADNLTTTGNTSVGGTLGVTGVATFSTHVALGDSDILKLGAAPDMQLYHDGSNSYITNATGALKVATETSGIAVTIGHTTSETTIADNATITGNLSVGGNFDVTGTLDFSDSNITNIGSIALDTITNDGTDITLDSSGDIILDADGADVTLKDDGTTFGSLTQSGGELLIKSGSTPTTALTFSGANVTAAGNLTVGGDLDVTGSFDMSDANITNIGSIALDTITNDGTDITLDSSGDIILDADGADITLKDAGTTFGSLTQSGGELLIKSGSTPTTAATFSGANVTLAGTVGSGAITSTGVVTGTGFTIGSAAIVEAELETIDGVTAGTVAASKAVVVDSNKDIGTFRNVTIDGTFSDGNYTFDTSGNVSGLGTVGSGAITSTGVVIGTTVEPNADTSSGDNAAIGYTATEGLILTGQGSTSDVTLKNDADTTVFSVPTGTQNVNFTGHILSDSGITINVASDITLDADGAQVWLSDGGSIYGSLSSSSQGSNTDTGNLYISSYGTDKDILIGGNDGGSFVTALTLDMSEAGTAIFHENIESTGAGEHNITLSSASSSSPTISLTNTNTDNNGAILKFSRDDGDAGAASDISGVISFYSDDAAQNNQEFARISGVVLDATSGGEEGGLDFYVAEYDGTVTKGMAIAGLSSDGNITVDISTHDGSAGGLKLGGTLVTSTAAELNILDGVTSTAAELNILDGVTATAAELNYCDGVTSNIQTQISALDPTALAIALG